MFNKYREEPFQDSEGESPWISFTDLMAGFLIVLLLALTAAIIMLTLEQAELRKERETVSEELQKARVAEAKAREELEKALLSRKKAEDEKSRMLKISDQFVKLINDIKKTQEEIVLTIGQMDDYDKSRKELLTDIQRRLKEKNIEIEISKAGDILHISESNLSFSLGSYKVEEKFDKTIVTIGDEVANQLSTSRLGEIIDTVFVEGHTDNVRNAKEMGNWGLSAYRAISVWNHWEHSNGKANTLQTLKNKQGEALFSVTGYGETRPREIFAAQSTIDQAVNRRIDLRFNLQTAKSDLLKQLSTQVNDTLKKIEDAHQTLQKQFKEKQR